MSHETPADSGATRDALPHLTGDNERAGTKVGPYKLLQRMGEGGMGEVWMAEQTEPVQRRVALKIIKAGLDSKQVLARFEAERQALAMMDHPNIAKVLDAGATSDGRPFVVMELVKGIPFTRYCDQEHLTPTQRLELFIPICNAVQHAHQKGIIHRDLKPSNVLIALYDGKAVPKVIDFGIAKATHQKLTERTMFTEVGQIVGTLEYMAPEQAELNNLDIDTRADIYSLGVMLYELLTGEPPFTAKQLRSESFVEMLRLIREVEPSKPSTKLSSSHELPAIAAKRKLEPKKLTGMMQGDLDWIVMKCLEKDRSRRYDTANQLGQELQRFLADEPVQAGPPSAGYRMKKFLRRNKGPVVAAALVFVALIAGITSTSIALVSASQARDAEARQRKTAEDNEAKAVKAADEAKAANRTAQGRLEQIEKSNLLLESMFNLKTPLAGMGMMGMGGMPGMLGMAGMGAMGMSGMGGMIMGGPGMAMMGMPPGMMPAGGFGGYGGGIIGMMGVLPGGLSGAVPDVADQEPITKRWSNQLYVFAGSLEESSSNNPETVVRVWHTVGVALTSLGESKRAIELLKKAHTQRTKLLGEKHPDTLKTLDSLAFAYFADNQLREAESAYENTLRIRKEILPAGHPEILMASDNVAAMCTASQDQKQIDRGFALFELNLETRIAKLGPDHGDCLASMIMLMGTYEAHGKKERVKQLQQRRLEGLKLALLKRQAAKLGPEDPNTLSLMRELAGAYEAFGQAGQGRLLWQEIKIAFDKKHPDNPHHADRIISTKDLADAYFRAGQHEEIVKSVPLYAELFAKQKETFGFTYSNHAYQTKPLKAVTAAAPPPGFTGLGFMSFGGMGFMGGGLYGMMGMAGTGMPMSDPSGTTTPVFAAYAGMDVFASMNDLAHKYFHAKQSDKAAALLAEYVAAKRKRDKTLQHGSIQFDRELAAVGVDLLRHDQPAAAEPILRECHDLRGVLEPKSWGLAQIKYLLGDSLRAQKKFAAAEPLLLQGYEGLKKHPAEGTQSIQTLADAADRLVQLYEEQKNLKEAARFAKELADQRKRLETAKAEAEQATKKFEQLHAEANKAQADLAQAQVHLTAKEPAKALPLIDSYLKHRRGIEGYDAMNFTNELEAIALNLLKHDQPGAAEPLVRELLALRTKQMPLHWQIFSTQSLLGGCLLAQKKYQDAEPLLLLGYEGMRRRQVQMNPHEYIREIETLDRLVQLYETLNRKAEADTWRRERDTRKTHFRGMGYSF